MMKKQNHPTLKELHEAIRDAHKEYRNSVLNAIGSTTLSSFYDIVSGTRKVSPAEKEAIAAIYGKKVEEIEWQDAIVLCE